MISLDPKPEVSIRTWVEAAGDDPRDQEFRQAVHTVLDAVAALPGLSSWIALKGAVLLALRYDFTRPTRDIDFSTIRRIQDVEVDALIEDIQQALPAAVDRLPYGLACRVQSHEIRPPSEDATFPTLRIGIGYAPSLDTARMRRLRSESGSPQILKIDLSFNERLQALDWLSLDPAIPAIRAYSLADIVAEKLRAMLQQPVRNRFRAQDVLDIDHLLRTQPSLSEPAIQATVLATLRAKSEDRSVPIEPSGLRDPEVRRRSARDYGAFAAQLSGPPPPFDDVYDRVTAWYESLPWGSGETH